MLLMESRIHGDMYVRFGGRYLETYHRKVSRRRISSLLMLLCEENSYKLPVFCTFQRVSGLNYSTDRQGNHKPLTDANGERLPQVSVLKGEKSFPVFITTFTVVDKETKEKIKAEIEELKSNVASKKIEIETAKASIEKYKSQQDNVRNNREYDVLTKEIEFQSLEVELCEKRIREYTAGIKSKEEEIVKSEQLLEERKKDLEVKKNELDEIISETKQEEEKLREKAKNLEATIEPRLLQAFKRIRKNSRNGLGITYVQRDACGGCFNKIPPQKQLDIRMRKKIIVCEYCGRIMIDPELAGVETEKHLETKMK